jgi:hypothetical protein
MLLLAPASGEAEQLDDLVEREQGLARSQSAHGADDLVEVGGLV